MKILVTGSRDWSDRSIIERELRKFPTGTVLVHGACPTGADAIADTVAHELGFVVRPYPADWESLGRGAGPARNAEMVREEHRRGEPIDLCLAFALDLKRARGTRDCSERAKKAGIRVQLVDS